MPPASLTFLSVPESSWAEASAAGAPRAMPPVRRRAKRCRAITAPPFVPARSRGRRRSNRAGRPAHPVRFSGRLGLLDREHVLARGHLLVLPVPDHGGGESVAVHVGRRPRHVEEGSCRVPGW